jgi:hypothetical protein
MSKKPTVNDLRVDITPEDVVASWANWEFSWYESRLCVYQRDPTEWLPGNVLGGVLLSPIDVDSREKATIMANQIISGYIAAEMREFDKTEEENK